MAYNICKFDSSGGGMVIPNGKTILPTDDIQIWLNCANIWDKTYTTITEVLTDTNTLSILISNNNAVDYMFRSKNWITSITTDATAMNYIGLNNYTSNTLLDDSIWCNAICDSTYFESVLNACVPTMTSNTAPEGIVSASYYGDGEPYRAFDKSNSTYWSRYQGDDTFRSCWINYEFIIPVRIVKLGVFPLYSSYCRVKDFTIYGSNDNSNYNSIKSFTSPSSNSMTYYKMIDNTNYYKTIRLYLTSSYGFSGAIREIQYYGRR